MRRHRILEVTVNAFFSLIIMGLFYAQVLNYNLYSNLAKNNAIRIIPIDGPRGTIFDRNNVPLVRDRLSFDVSVVYQELDDEKRVVNLLNEVLGVSPARIKKSLWKASARPYAPVVILEDIDRVKAIQLEEASIDTKGLILNTRSRRHYIYNEVGAHIFGYLSEVTKDELEDLKSYGYRMKDLVGRDGLERYYDMYLAGVDGGMQIQVDNRGRHVKTLGLKEPSSGKDLHLSIDISLQTHCDKLLGQRSGAIIVINAKDGEVLALASHPAFDPNAFVRPEASPERLNLLKDEKTRPLFNRAVSGVYEPGSVFKVVVASSALATKKMTNRTRFFCSGSYLLGNRRFDCWKEEGHGSQDIKDAIMNSCNVFFYQTGRTVGADDLESYTKLFGFGRLTGIDLPDETKGLVPGRLWKRMYKKDNWYEGDTVNYAIGQGYLLVTPIQILEMMVAMANKGTIVRPHIVRRIGSSGVSGRRQKNIGLKENTIRDVREGLFRVVNSEGGTGRRAYVEGVPIAGKTGTAQNPKGETHAWFSGFAPFDDPKICLVVFLEHGGKGGILSSEIAKGIFEYAKSKGYL